MSSNKTKKIALALIFSSFLTSESFSDVNTTEQVGKNEIQLAAVHNQFGGLRSTIDWSVSFSALQQTRPLKTRITSVAPKARISSAPLPAVRPVVKPRQAKSTGVFGTKAISFSTIASQKHWDRVRLAASNLKIDGCRSDGYCAAEFAPFSKLVAQTDDLAFYKKLTEVNRLVNQKIAYREDEDVFGQLDYWASARETIHNGRGDCEDFAILKYSMLLKMGVPAKSMSLVVLRDKKRGLYHAVLSISSSQGHFILDNVTNVVYRDTKVAHYQPLYSFSTDRSWLHGKVPSRNPATQTSFNSNAINPDQGSINGSASIAPL